MNATTAVVLLNWNGWRDTLECLNSLQKLVHPSFAVIVVDNASTDGSMIRIEEWLTTQPYPDGVDSHYHKVKQDEITALTAQLQHRSVTLVQSNSNGGFAAGNNLGLRIAMQAQCTNMWLLNNDTVVDQGALIALEARMAQDTSIGMVGSVLCYFDQPNIIQTVGGVQFNYWRARGTQLGHGLLADSKEVESIAAEPLTYVAGASMLVSKAFLDDAGLMYEGYFLYFEEIDWACKVKNRWTAATAAKSIVFHKEGSSIGTSSRTERSYLSQYYLNRNLVNFYSRNKPKMLSIALLNGAIEVIKFIIQGNLLMALCTAKALWHGLLGQTGMRQL
jgi:GT2 family glycosyltransferase